MKDTVIVRISERGQIYLPKSYRRILGMKKGSKLVLFRKENELVLQPLPDDPIEAGCGYLPGDIALGEELLKERKADAKKEG